MPSRTWSERILFLLGVAIMAMPFLGFPSIFKTVFFVVSGGAILIFTLLVKISDYRQVIIAEEVSHHQTESVVEPEVAVAAPATIANTPVSALFVAESETVLTPTASVLSPLKSKVGRPRKTTIRRKTISPVNPSRDHESVEAF